MDPRLLCLALAVLTPLFDAVGDDMAKKEAVVASIERRKAELVAISDQIWRFAETGFRETRSSRLLADYAEAQGFKVERGVAGMPTAFVASYGTGKPVVGILGEYDALPGISQKATLVKEALEIGAAGHGCGHNLFGTGSLAAAIALKELMAVNGLRGTIRFFGTPDEENIGGKLYLLRDGMFRDVEVMLAWHPDSQTAVGNEGFQAKVQIFVDFKGKTAHAAVDPWNGRSASDSMELFTHGVNMLREHVRPTVRMHYTILEAGDIPNVVPDHARVWVWLRDSKREGVEELLARTQDVARGAALMAGVESAVTLQTGTYNENINETGLKVLHANMAWLGPIQYTAEEQEFARAIQRALGNEAKGLDGSIQPLKPIKPDPPGGSSDIGDVSWNLPTLGFYVTTAPADVPWHAWPVVASGGMSIGHKGMLFAAKTLAATGVDLFEDPALRNAIRAEFIEKTKGFAYKPFIPDGPPPVPRQ